MSDTKELVVTLPKGRVVDVQVGAHLIHTDQPRDNGGEDSGPSPFQLFLASIGACAGIFVQGFCAARGIRTEGIRIVEHPHTDEAGTLVAVDLDVQLPADFPEKYREAILKVIDKCSVKRAIHAQPEFRTRTTLAGGARGAEETLAAEPA